jgi:anti-anti-sigma factor
MRPDAVSRAVVDGIGAIVWEARPGRAAGEAHFSFVSDGTLALLGHPPSAWLADPRFWLMITHPDDRERVVGQIVAAARSGQDADFEFRGLHADGRVLWLRDIVRVERDPEGGPPRMSGVVVDITPRKEAQERLARLHVVAMRLTGLLTADDVARTVVAEGRGALGAAGAAVYVVEDSELQLIAAEGYPEAAVAEMKALTLDDATPVAEVIQTGLPVWIGTAAEADRRYPARPAKALGRGASCALPLIAEDRTLGALAVRMPEERPFAAADRVLLDVLAAACGQALLLARSLATSARLYESERAARERTARLQTITAALSNALSPADVAATILREAMPAVGSHMGGVWQLSEDGTAIVPLAQAGYPDPSLEGWRHLPLSQPLPMTDALRDGRVRWVPTLEAKIAAWPHLEESFRLAGSGSMAILPLIARDEPVGSISFSFPVPSALDAEDLSFLESLASQCAQALERARLFEAERRVAVTLQRSLLPQRLPVVDGVELAVRYLPAAGLEAGGDFYEAIRLPGGSIGVAVGDVVGRGAPAAAAMGQLRSALRAFAMSGAGPAEVLANLSAYAETVEGAMAATAAYAIFDPAGGQLRYACAGHPWPLLAGPGGPPRYLKEGRSVPLACVAEPVYEEAVERLAPGDTLLLFTDGLTERRGVDADVSMERLRESVGGLGDLGLAGLLDAVVAGQGADAPMDDVALLAVRLASATTRSHHLRVPAVATSVGEARMQMRGWLAQAGVTEDVAADVLLASGEAVANAVEHAYTGDVPGALEISLRTGAEIEVEVRDEGRWKQEGGVADRGRGFMLMRALMDDVEVGRTAAGTSVRLRLRSASGKPPAGGPTLPAREPQAASLALEAGTARVTGDLDLEGAPRIGERLAEAAAGGPLAVDLTDVGYLDSVGARMLVELSRAVPLRVIAPPGSVARRTLELAGLDATLRLEP